MSVSVDIGSQETVTSKYVVPVIHLCCDEETGFCTEGVEGVAANKKSKLMDSFHTGFLAESSRKKIKIHDPNALNLSQGKMEISNPYRPFDGVVDKTKCKEDFIAVRAPKEVVFIDISDDSSD